AALAECPADELVQGVVAAHVLTGGEQPAGGVEEGRGVEAAGRGEEPLRFPEPDRQRRDHLRRNLRPRWNGPWNPQPQGVEPRLAADAAGAGREEVAVQAGELRLRHARGELDLDDVGAAGLLPGGINA